MGPEHWENGGRLGSYDVTNRSWDGPLLGRLRSCWRRGLHIGFRFSAINGGLHGGNFFEGEEVFGGVAEEAGEDEGEGGGGGVRPRLCGDSTRSGQTQSRKGRVRLFRSLATR